MSYENVKFKKRNITVVDGYFYSISEESDTLLKKSSDGTTAFTYPLDNLLNNEVQSLEFDGVYFWSLEDGANLNELVVRRWFIDNYICKLQQVYTLSSGILYGGALHKFDSNAFSIEHYHTTLSATVSGGSDTLYINKYWDSSTISGATLRIGPNSDGEYEDAVVNNVVSSGVLLSTPITYSYSVGDAVNYYNNLWLFNNYNGLDSSTGALYKFNVTHSGITYDAHYSGGAYKDIEAATFYNVDSFTEFGNVDTLAFIKATNMLFVNVSDVSGALSYYGSMVMDNIESDESTVIVVYDVSMDDQNVYRLQTKATYYGNTYNWSEYNYQMASLNSFVTSLALAAYPGIIAANTVSTAEIVAVVKDQFGQPVVGRMVYFTEDDPVGSITGGTPISTDNEGRSQTIYKSGNTAREVKITATVEQV